MYRYHKIITACVVVAAFLYACAGNNNTKNDTAAEAQYIRQGQLLAVKYCQTCHQLPDPSLLDRERWSSVLPVMGLYIGITPHTAAADPLHEIDVSVLPDRPLIDTLQWKQLITYYIMNAPDRLPAQKRVAEVIHELPFFTVQLPPAFLYGTTSIASYSKIDTAVSPHRALVADGAANRFMVLNNSLQVLQDFTTIGTIVDCGFESKRILACSIGSDMVANDLKHGTITLITINTAGKIDAHEKPLFDSLQRPVHVTPADFNGDGRTDYLVSQFGNMTGALTWIENKGQGQYTSHTLRKLPGALQTIVQDADHDGLPDVWALFSQGEEGIFLFTNKGKEQFEEREVLRFPPSYGSSSFELVDYNKDGHPDIIYTCGDNGDYSRVLKPYHGVYIYLNNGHNQFTQQYFYPINGCYKALARDFDGDGDLDIATISFFPAAATPWEAFIYLENKGNDLFQPYTLPAGTPFQKGLTMDAGDLDGDGKTDLLLGNGFFTSNTAGGYKEPLFILLKGK